MKVLIFCDIHDFVIDDEFTVEYSKDGMTGDADITVLDINSIFDFEENKIKACKEKFASVAIIDDESDYDAFRNFGIDAWIKSSDIDQLNGVLKLVNKRILS